MTHRQQLKQRLEWVMRDCGSLSVADFNTGCCEWLQPGVLFHPEHYLWAEVDRMDKNCTFIRFLTEVRNTVKKGVAA